MYRSYHWLGEEGKRELTNYRVNLIIMNFRQEFLAYRKNWKP